MACIFFGAAASDVLAGLPSDDSGYTPVDLQQEIQSLTNPVAPFGSALQSTVEDLQAQTRVKVQRARQAVATTMDLLGLDLLGASLRLDVRKAQDPARSFGPAPTDAWAAFRKLVPLKADPAKVSESNQMTAASFVKTTPAAMFYARTGPAGTKD